MNSVWSNDLSLKYMKGINHHLDIGIRRFKVVAKTHILSTIFQIRLSSFLSLNLLCSTEYLNRKDGPFLFYSCCIYVRDIIQCNRVTRSNEITMKKNIYRVEWKLYETCILHYSRYSSAKSNSKNMFKMVYYRKCLNSQSRRFYILKLLYTTSQKKIFQALRVNLIFSKTLKFDYNTFYYEKFKKLENKPKRKFKKH